MALITWQVFSRSYSSDDLGPETTDFADVVYRKSRKVMIGSLLYIGSTFIVQLPLSLQNMLLQTRHF